MTSFILTTTHITLVFENGQSTTIYNQDERYDDIVAEVKAKNWEQVYHLVFAKKHAKEEQLEPLGNDVYLKHGIVYFKDEPIHGTLVDRMLDMHANGFDIEPMCLFLKNLMANPSFRSVNELYGFLEASDLPITEDGHFLAYKRVRNNFKDIHSNTFDNSPGALVKMQRNEVDEDKDKTCSDGLHFCSRAYLPHFYADAEGARVMMLKINPRDVVSIPSDYNNAKGRSCEYTIVRELDISNDIEELEGSLWIESILDEPIDDGGTSPKNQGRFGWVEDILETLPPMPDRPPSANRAVEQLNLPQSLRVNHLTPIVEKRFRNATEAMHLLGIDSSSITKVCNGDRRTAGGYSWRWADSA